MLGSTLLGCSSSPFFLILHCIFLARPWVFCDVRNKVLCAGGVGEGATFGALLAGGGVHPGVCVCVCKRVLSEHGMFG